MSSDSGSADGWDNSSDDDAPKPQKKQEKGSDDDAEDWEKATTVMPSKKTWDDEDDEDDVAPQQMIKSKPRGKLKPKQIKALKMKKFLDAEKKKNEAKRIQDLRRQQLVDSELDPMTRRLKAKKLAEEADHAIAMDLFGEIDETKGIKDDYRDEQAEEDAKVLGMAGTAAPVEAPKPKLMEMKLANRKDVDRFVLIIAKKMEETSYTRKNKNYFLKGLLPKLCKSLTLDDMNAIKKQINVICNKKAKDPNKKKKKNKFSRASVGVSNRGQLTDYSQFDDFDNFF